MSSFFKFIKTFVIHLTAKRALERHCFRTIDQEVNISLFAAQRSSLVIPAESWPKMEDTIRASFLSDTGSSADATAITKVVKILQDKITRPPANYNERSRGSLVNLKTIMDGKPLFFRGGMHCETVLRTLKQYFESSPGGDDNTNLILICKVILFTYLPAQSDHLS